MAEQIFFFSNHNDPSFLQNQYPGHIISIIKHPLLRPEWDEGESLTNCNDTVNMCLPPDRLIATGDYFLVMSIVAKRLTEGKPTGFITYKKIETSSDGKGYRNKMEQHGVRWLTPEVLSWINNKKDISPGTVFLSNHPGTLQDLENLTGEKITFMQHPHLNHQWSEKELLEKQSDVMHSAILAENLIINGDFFFVALITMKRLELGKKTGFVVMKKENPPDSRRGIDRHVTYRSVLRLVGIRWIRPDKR